MQRRLIVMAVILLLIGGTFFVYDALSTDTQEERESSLISDDYDLPRLGFETVDGSYEFSFPEDYGPHPRFQREVWQLQTADDCNPNLRVEFRLLNILPEDLVVDRESEWAVESVMTGELVVRQSGDVVIDRLVDSRLALDLAGADEDRVWIEAMTLDWAAGEFIVSTVAERIQSSLTFDEASPVEQDNWYAYTRRGRIEGEIERVGETTLALDCNVQLAHRFGTP